MPSYNRVHRSAITLDPGRPIHEASSGWRSSRVPLEPSLVGIPISVSTTSSLTKAGHAIKKELLNRLSRQDIMSALFAAKRRVDRKTSK